MAENESKPTPRPPTPSDRLTFEQAYALLEEIVRDLEDGQTDLAESLARLEQGMACLRRCHGLLEDAEQRIERLLRVNPAGRPETAPFDASDLEESLEDRADGRHRRRSANPRASAENQQDRPRGELF